MPKRPQPEQPEAGLYRQKGSSRWSLRLNGKRLTTGTAEVAVATAGTLHDLRSAQRVEVDDPDVEPWVARWWHESLADAVSNGRITGRTAEEYYRQIRALVPAAAPLRRSELTEEYVKAQLRKIGGTSSTRRRYLAAWSLFLKYARRRVPLTIDPLQDREEWQPSNGQARTTWWTPSQSQAVLDRMSGEARIAVALSLGSGLERSARLGLRGRHFAGQPERWFIAPGTKNEFRRDRVIRCDRWAWAIVEPHLRTLLPNAPVFTLSDDVVRDQFYAAQRAAGFVTDDGGEYHTLHDCRHTYAITRLLGLDGEPRSTMKEVAHNLGHADEQMVSRVYARVGGAQRLALMQLSEVQEQQRAVR